MPAEKEDPRQRRSREALLAALAAEAAEKPLGSITVSSICRRAEVDRTTFYRHFEDKEDLLNRGVALLADRFIEQSGAGNAADPRFADRVSLFFKQVGRQKDLLAPFFAPGAQGVMEGKIKRELFDFFVRERLEDVALAGKSLGEEEKAMLATMTVSALFGLLRSWLTEHPEWKAEEAARRYELFVSRGALAFLE